MQDTLPTSLQDKIAELASLANAACSAHYRLVWLVGASAGDRSVLLRVFSNSEEGTLLDIGQAMSKALLEIPASLRPASVEECFSDLLDTAESRLVCLDRLEILFEPSLRLDPVELVKGASRHQTIIASWPGRKEGRSFVFGPEGHPAHFLIPSERLECQFLEIDS